MSLSDPPYPSSRLDELLAALTQHRLTEDEGRELNQLLKANSTVRLVYLRAVDQEVSLKRLLRAYEDAADVRSAKWLLRLQAELEAESAHAPPPPPRVRAIHRIDPARDEKPAEPPAVPQPAGRRRGGGRQWKAAAALAIALCGIVLWSLRRSPASVATLTKSSGARWEGPAIADGAGLAAGRQLSLTAGCAEITFGHGQASIIVEGPSAITIDSPMAVSLASGRLAGNVIGGGFRVRTASTLVTDLGTEFGVSVDPNGTTDVEVFKGKVKVEPVTTGQASAPSRVLTEGEAATAKATGVDVDPGGATPQRFVRTVQSQAAALDVVDLVAGGDGTTHRRGMDIDPTSGEAGGLPPAHGRGGDAAYHPVRGLPVVNGVFIPMGGQSPVQVSTAGHTFQFPVTGGGSYDQILTVGGIRGAWDRIPQVIGDVNYQQPGHGILFMHANEGLTLDLDAVRRLHPGKTPARFHCTVAKAERKPVDPLRKVDLFVLVDGKPRFQRPGVIHNEPVVIDVPLQATDHFLTLSVTDGGDGETDDGTLWGDPVLDLIAP